MSHALVITLGILIAGVLSGCSDSSNSQSIEERANEFFDAGDYDKAKIEYLNVLRADPQNQTAIKNLGTIWYEQGAPVRAYPFLTMMKELAPDDFAGRNKLANTYLTLGELEEARAEAIEILERSPADEEALILLSASLRTDDDIEDIETRLQELENKNTTAFHLAECNVALKKEDLETAAAAVDRALAADPDSASAHLASGQLALAKRELERAQEAFREAAALAAPRSIARYRSAELLIAAGAEEEGRALLMEITRETPDFLPAWRSLSLLAFEEEGYDEALQFLENIFSRDPKDFDGRILEARIQGAQGRHDKAIDTLTRLNAAYPGSPLIEYRLAQSLRAEGSESKAVQALERVLAIDPDDADATMLLATVHLEAKRPEIAVPLLEELIRARPDLVQAQHSLATAYRELGELGKAAGVFSKQIETAPGDYRSSLNLGILLREQEKFSEARDAFRVAEEMAPDNPEVEYQMAELELAMNDLDAALERIQTQLDKAPDTGAFHYLLGRVFAAKGDWPQAKEALEKTIALEPNLLGAYYLLTAGYMENEKPEEALQQMEANLVKNPSDFQARFLSASLYKEMGDEERAIEAFKKVIEIEPGFAAAYNNLAYLYSANPDQLEQAYEAAKQARQLEPANPAIADTFGWIAFQREDYAMAMGLIEEAAKGLAGNVEVQFHLGMAAYMMGETDQAREALEKALAGAGELDDDDAQRVRTRLATIGIVTDDAKLPSVDELEGLVAEDAGDVIALVELGKAHERANQFNDAVTTYGKALEINPDLVAVLANLARLQAGPLKDPVEALAFAKRAREIAPNDPKIAGVLGEVALQARNFEWASSLLEESLRHDRDNPSTLLALGRAIYSLGRVEEARAKMERVLSVSPDSPWADEARAFLSLTRTVDKGDLVAALAEADEALAANPGDVPALMIKAAAQTSEGNEEGARETLLRVLEEYPDFGPAQRDLAILYSGDASGREKAYELAMAARNHLPNDAFVARTLGVLSFHRADYSYAVQLLEECGKSEALDAEALYYLGMAQIQLNRKDKGYEALRGALEQGGLADPLATKAREAIEAAEPGKVE